jgi:hypothetical protein
MRVVVLFAACAAAGAESCVRESTVRLDPARIASLGIGTRVLERRSAPRATALRGEVVVEPTDRWELRTPFASRIHASRAWPRPGETFVAGTPIGTFDPVLSDAQRASMEGELAQDEARLDATRKELAVVRADLKRVLEPGADGKPAPQAEIDAAKERFDAAREKELAATEPVRMLKARLHPNVMSPDARTVVVEHDGVVAEVLAQPEELLAKDAPVLRFVVAKAFVRAEFSAGTQVDTSGSCVAFLDDDPARAIEVVRFLVAFHDGGGGSCSIDLAPVAPTPRADQGATVLVEAKDTPVEGWLVPRSAVSRDATGAHVWVETGKDEFARRALDTDLPTREGWLTNSSWAKDARVVVAGAQGIDAAAATK